MNKKMTVVVLCICFVAIAAFIGGRCYQNNKTKKIVYVDFVSEEIEQVNETEHKYQFLPLELSNYIVQMCEQLEVDSDLAVAILMQENPEINFEAMHRNTNGTIDVGLWQLNDKYLYTSFSNNFWRFDDVELNAFDWKHNTFIALHQIEWLQSRLKVFDDVVMGYNAGIGAVMNRKIPESTKVYLCRVKNNYNLLKASNY